MACWGKVAVDQALEEIEAIVAAEEAIGFYTVVNQDIFLIGMDHPDNLGAIVKVFDNFGVDFSNGVARGENFDARLQRSIGQLGFRVGAKQLLQDFRRSLPTTNAKVLMNDGVA